MCFGVFVREMRLQRVVIVLDLARRQCISSFHPPPLPLRPNEAHALSRTVPDPNGVLWHIQLSHRVVPFSGSQRGPGRADYRLSPGLQSTLYGTGEVSCKLLGCRYVQCIYFLSPLFDGRCLPWHNSAPPNSRSNARSKLTRLTIQQFHELSTDVYDELVRRNKENEGSSIRVMCVQLFTLSCSSFSSGQRGISSQTESGPPKISNITNHPL
jgi:hypothetical protein